MSHAEMRYHISFRRSLQGTVGIEPVLQSGMGMRWLIVSWWFIVPVPAVAALLHAWDHTAVRYTTGQLPRMYGLGFNVHVDLGPMLLLLFLLSAAALWLIPGIAITVYSLFKRRWPDHRIAWRTLVLAIAFALPFLPARAWDEALLHTIGPGQAGGDLLATAAAAGDTARLRQLLARGIAVDAPNYANPANSPALWVAVRDARPEAVALLLERGADPSRRSHYGAVPLLRAVNTGDIAAVRLLVQHGADPCASEIHFPRNVRTVVTVQSAAQQKNWQEILAILPSCATPTPAGEK